MTQTLTEQLLEETRERCLAHADHVGRLIAENDALKAELLSVRREDQRRIDALGLQVSQLERALQDSRRRERNEGIR